LTYVEDGAFVKAVLDWNKRLEVLLSLHRIQISNDQYVFCRSSAHGKCVVWIDQKVPKNIPADASDIIKPPRHHVDPDEGTKKRS
jgi:hypothetical protein